MPLNLKDGLLGHTLGSIHSMGRLIGTTDVKKTDPKFGAARRCVGEAIQKISKICGIEVNFKKSFWAPRVTTRSLAALTAVTDNQVSDEANERDRIVFDHLSGTCSSLARLIHAADIRPDDVECGWYRMQLESEMRSLCEKCGIPATFSTKYPDPEPLTAEDLREIGFLPRRRRTRSRRQTH